MSAKWSISSHSRNEKREAALEAQPLAVFEEEFLLLPDLCQRLAKWSSGVLRFLAAICFASAALCLVRLFRSNRS